MYIFFSRLNPTILGFRPKYIFSSKLVFLKFPEFQLSYTRKFGTLWAVLQAARTNRCSYRLTVAIFVVAIFVVAIFKNASWIFFSCEKTFQEFLKFPMNHLECYLFFILSVQIFSGYC